FFFQAEDGIRADLVTGVQTCALPISGERDIRRQRGALVAAFVLVDLDDELLAVLERILRTAAGFAVAAKIFAGDFLEGQKPVARSEERRVGKACRWWGGAGR